MFYCIILFCFNVETVIIILVIFPDTHVKECLTAGGLYNSNQISAQISDAEAQSYCVR